ncbi:MAG TPA: hypothetical protein DEB25_07050 [Desulfobulbaceae bacterium]|nr:hypothetical protein [Desulfobulbaceae bacterium]
MLRKRSGTAFIMLIMLSGIIGQIDQEKIIIDGVSFSYEWKVNPDFAPIALERFSAGEEILFQVNSQGRIIKISPMSATARPTVPAAPSRKASDTQPDRSVPIRQHNGVWTNAFKL